MEQVTPHKGIRGFSHCETSLMSGCSCRLKKNNWTKIISFYFFIFFLHFLFVSFFDVVWFLSPPYFKKRHSNDSFLFLCCCFCLFDCLISSFPKKTSTKTSHGCPIFNETCEGKILRVRTTFKHLASLWRKLKKWKGCLFSSQLTWPTQRVIWDLDWRTVGLKDKMKNTVKWKKKQKMGQKNWYEDKWI